MMYAAPHTTRLEPSDLLELFPERVPPRSVMVIDDSPTVRAVVEATLHREGIQVSAYRDGLAALGALQRHEVDIPDVVLIDIGMPKMDGYEIAKILRSKDDMERSVLLMLSAHDGVLDKLRAKMVGANGFIAKPFRAPFLLETVLMYLNAGAVM